MITNSDDNRLGTINQYNGFNEVRLNLSQSSDADEKNQLNHCQAAALLNSK